MTKKQEAGGSGVPVRRTRVGVSLTESSRESPISFGYICRPRNRRDVPHVAPPSLLLVYSATVHSGVRRHARQYRLQRPLADHTRQARRQDSLSFFLLIFNYPRSFLASACRRFHTDCRSAQPSEELGREETPRFPLVACDHHRVRVLRLCAAPGHGTPARRRSPRNMLGRAGEPRKATANANDFTQTKVAYIRPRYIAHTVSVR